MERPLRDFRDRSVKLLSVGRWETGTGLKSLVRLFLVFDFYNSILKFNLIVFYFFIC